MTDEDSRLCYDCWVELDIIDVEKDEQSICLCTHLVHMAKLYWRVKRDGKWIMTPAKVTFMDTTRVQVAIMEDEK